MKDTKAFVLKGATKRSRETGTRKSIFTQAQTKEKKKEERKKRNNDYLGQWRGFFWRVFFELRKLKSGTPLAKGREREVNSTKEENTDMPFK